MSILTKLRQRNVYLILFALAAGLFAAWSANQYLNEKVQKINEAAKVATETRIVVDKDVAAGTLISEEILALREIPIEFTNSYTFKPEDFDSINNKVISSDIKKGETITRFHISEAKPETFSNRLTKGSRAVTLPVDAINSAAGMLAPGDKIDLYVTFEYRRRKVTAPLLQGVKILATGSQVNDNQEAYSTVTLETSAEDAAKLVSARSSGNITSFLRNPHDTDVSNTGVRGDVATLIGIATAPIVPKKKSVILYGNSSDGQSAGRLANSSNAETSAKQPDNKGVFILPGGQSLISNKVQQINQIEQSQEINNDINNEMTYENTDVYDFKQDDQSRN